MRRNILSVQCSEFSVQERTYGFNDKHCYYDASWRIPLIMSMPGTLAQGEKRDFAIWNDLTATILGAAGISYRPIQGFDLFTPLSQGRESPRRCAVGTLFTSCALATQRWKLEYYFEDGIGRLFDRKNDALERNDLYSDPTYTDIRKELVSALLSWRAEIGDLQHLIEGKARLVGPVAARARAHMDTIQGTDAERRLNERAERIDEDTRSV